MRKRRGSRVKKGRSIDEGQAMSGGRWEEGFISVARGGGRRLQKPPKSFDNVSLFILTIFQTNFVLIVLQILPPSVGVLAKRNSSGSL